MQRHTMSKQFVSNDCPSLLVSRQSVGVVDEQVLDRSRLDERQQTDQYGPVIQVIMETRLPTLIPQSMVETQFNCLLDSNLLLCLKRGSLLLLDDR